MPIYTVHWKSCGKSKRKSTFWIHLDQDLCYTQFIIYLIKKICHYILLNNQAALEKLGTGSIHQYFHHFHRAGYRIHYKSARVLHSTKLGQISRDQIFSLKLWPEKEFLKLELGQKKGKLSQLRWIHQSQFLPQFQSYWFKKIRM